MRCRKCGGTNRSKNPLCSKCLARDRLDEVNEKQAAAALIDDETAEELSRRSLEEDDDES